VAVAFAVALLAIGAGTAYLLMRPSQVPAHDMEGMQREPATGTGDVGRTEPSSSEAPLPDVTVTLTEEAVERAGIEVTPVRAGGTAARVRVPGVVEPNAYRRVTVTPLVAGRVTRVLVELGDRVRRSQTMAQIYSPELAEAQTTYVSMRAELQAHEKKLRRTERLIEIGAASREELEHVHAEHASLTASVAGARSRLVLLGMSASAVDRLSTATEITATTNVPAPIAGVVTEREANTGLNVDPTMKLFTIVDLSSVWIVGALYEKDFSRVRVGSPATVTTTAYPDLVVQGRVSYIDPQVDPGTRTAKVRVEVGNPHGELRLGMYAEMQVGETGAASTAVVPRSAVQTVADRHVVYLVNPKEPGRFVEREVRLGNVADDEVEVLAGVSPGDIVVAHGSFFVRAERERLGLRQMAPAPRSQSTETGVQTARVTVGDQGYEPARLTLRQGVPARITFVRTSDKTCGTEVVFPSLNITRPLPLNQPVDIEFTPQKSGEVSFVCGMNMLHGAVVVQ
jgi:RND family efflux transporter MFP subunit